MLLEDRNRSGPKTEQSQKISAMAACRKFRLLHKCHNTTFQQTAHRSWMMPSTFSGMLGIGFTNNCKKILKTVRRTSVSHMRIYSAWGGRIDWLWCTAKTEMKVRSQGAQRISIRHTINELKFICQNLHCSKLIDLINIE